MTTRRKFVAAAVAAAAGAASFLGLRVDGRRTDAVDRRPEPDRAPAVSGGEASRPDRELKGYTTKAAAAQSVPFPQG